MKNLNKHLLKITKKCKARPVLNSAFFNGENGTVSATDSHRLLRYKNGYQGESMAINLETLTKPDGSYPNIENLIRFRNTVSMIVPSTLLTKETLQVIKAYKKDRLTVFFDCDTQGLVIYNQAGLAIFNTDNNFTNYPTNNTFYVNAQYFIDMLECLIDYRKEFLSVGIEMFFSESVRPITFKSEDDTITYLVTPIRKN